MEFRNSWPRILYKFMIVDGYQWIITSTKQKCHENLLPLSSSYHHILHQHIPTMFAKVDHFRYIHMIQNEYFVRTSILMKHLRISTTLY